MSLVEERPASPTPERSPVPPDQRLDELERDVQQYRVSRDSWTIIIFAIAAVAILAAVFATVVALTRDDGGEDGGGAEAAAGAAPQAITADLSEFAIELSSNDVTAAGMMTINNTGSQVHNVRIVGTDLISADIPGGSTGELDLSSLEPGTYEVICEIPGHADSGMRTSLTIGGSGAAAAAGGDTAGAAGGAGDHAEHGGMTEEEAAAMDQKMIDSILEFPAETEGRGNQPLEPEILPDGSKRFELTASIIDWEVEPGQVVQAWAYNGMVPGPRIDVEVGDTIEVEITNELPIGTDIHWHGIDVPFDQDGVAPITQDMVMPGETYTYRYTVNEEAVGMYHAHAHGDIAVPNGLFGTMYVGDMTLPAGQTISGYEIPADIELAQDLPMVLNDAGEIGLTLDGKSFPATQPIVAEVGDWIQVTYFNEGLQVHPMHLHGFEQFVIAKDGEELDQPYAADTILVGPGERYTVLFSPDQAGTWVWHCHILNHVEGPDGMFGMVTALVVE
jgi:FtsP/CotA-like multicopper oxidase with cupredoxin domain